MRMGLQKGIVEDVHNLVEAQTGKGSFYFYFALSINYLEKN